MNAINRLFIWGVLGATLSVSLCAAPIRTLSGLTGVRFYEVTGTATANDFVPNSSEMTTQRSTPLSSTNRDFAGLPNEHYDVFFSNADGTFNLDGEYISIIGYYGGSSSGINIGEVELLFSGASPLLNNFATGVVSFVPHFYSFDPASLANIGDGNPLTATAMGSVDEGDHSRITVGFDQSTSEVPEPGTWGAMAMGLAVIAARYRRRA